LHFLVSSYDSRAYFFISSLLQQRIHLKIISQAIFLRNNKEIELFLSMQLDTLKQFVVSDRFNKMLEWSFCLLSGLIALIHLGLTIRIDYPGVTGTVVFAIAAFIFCPPVKAPNWIKFILGMLLIIGT